MPRDPCPPGAPAKDGIQNEGEQRRRQKKKRNYGTNKTHKTNIEDTQHDRYERENVVINLKDQKPISAKGNFR